MVFLFFLFLIIIFCFWIFTENSWLDILLLSSVTLITLLIFIAIIGNRMRAAKIIEPIPKTPNRHTRAEEKILKISNKKQETKKINKSDENKKPQEKEKEKEFSSKKLSLEILKKSLGKNKKTTKTLKYGDITIDPFKETAFYQTREKVLIIKKGGFLSPFKCEISFIPLFEANIQEQTWSVEISTYRILKAKNKKEMENLINEEPMWRYLEDFKIIADDKLIQCKLIRFKSQRKTRKNGLLRETRGGGKIVFQNDGFEEICKSKILAMRYYGNCEKSEFELTNKQVNDISKICKCALTDLDLIYNGGYHDNNK